MNVSISSQPQAPLELPDSKVSANLVICSDVE